MNTAYIKTIAQVRPFRKWTVNSSLSNPMIHKCFFPPCKRKYINNIYKDSAKRMRCSLMCFSCRTEIFTHILYPYVHKGNLKIVVLIFVRALRANRATCSPKGHLLLYDHAIDFFSGMYMECDYKSSVIVYNNNNIAFILWSCCSRYGERMLRTGESS